MTAPARSGPGRLRRPGSGLAPLARREARWGFIFISPWIAGFLAFTLIPMIVSLVFTFTNVNLNQEEPLQFVGLKNYANMLSDQQTWDSLAVTIRAAQNQRPNRSSRRSKNVAVPWIPRSTKTKGTDSRVWKTRSMPTSV